MTIVLKSEWMIPCVETLKVLYDLDSEKYDEELETIEFTNEEKTKILMIVANERGKAGSLNTIVARRLKAFLDETNFDEVFVFGETQTSTAYNILKYNEKATVYTSNARIQLKTSEILEAFYVRAYKICEKECGVKPLQRDDCKATKKGAPSCQVRTLMDNAEFHARMGWKDQLLLDFSMLLEHEQEMFIQESIIPEENPN